MNPREEIKDIAPTLSQWNHSEGYIVPSNYFENLSNDMMVRLETTEKLDPYFLSLPDQLMAKIKEEEKTKVMTFKSYYKYVIAAGLLIAAGTMLWTNLVEEIGGSAYSMIEDSEDLDYIIDELSMEDIFDVEFIDDESLEEILANGEEQYTTDDLAEDLLYDAKDELLEEFL